MTPKRMPLSAPLFPLKRNILHFLFSKIKALHFFSTTYKWKTKQNYTPAAAAALHKSRVHRKLQSLTSLCCKASHSGLGINALCAVSWQHLTGFQTLEIYIFFYLRSLLELQNKWGGRLRLGGVELNNWTAEK